ncbi:beta-1,6-galactanase [Seiridium cupressi]
MTPEGPPVFSPLLSPIAEPTTWQTWYDGIKQGAAAIHPSNPDLLIYIQGQRDGVGLSKVVNGDALDRSPEIFRFDDFPGYADKLVLEVHSYDSIDLPGILGGERPGKHDCEKLKKSLYEAGFSALSGNTTNQFPVILFELGWA